jgi:hypothetical protein
MTYDEFENKFEPIENNLGDEGYLFETYGQEVDYVSQQEEHFVWTLIEVEDKLYIIPGFHYVNRLNYLITKNPWNEEFKNLEIKYED